LDWCCDDSGSSLNGVTPDAWIAYRHARDVSSRGGLRGFAFARGFSSAQGSGYGGSTPVPNGPWADHRYTLLFTGDIYPDFATLQFEVAYTVAVGSATGLPFVSDDIGGFHQYTEPNGSSSLADPDDLYVRWVQFATFQPILRLHSDHAYRLPWEYDNTAKIPAAQFLRLREALVPYTYTSAEQTIETGVPLVHGLYIDYPGEQSAYDYANQEYLYGPNLLVAPATTPGLTTTTEVWIPPGTWTNYFTGQ
jgi:alpha-glucosidase (family GH31 glycosyl hydrolase)